MAASIMTGARCGDAYERIVYMRMQEVHEAILGRVVFPVYHLRLIVRGNHRVDDEDIVFSTALRRKGEASAAGGVCHGATKRQSSAAFSSAAFVSRGTARSPSSCRSVAACAAVPLAMSA